MGYAVKLPNPCECGCGEPTRTDQANGRRIRFVAGHQNRGRTHGAETRAKIAEAARQQTNRYTGGLPPTPAYERLMRKTELVGDCIVWTGAVSANGYGAIGVGSTNDGTSRVVRAHRLAWEHKRGPVPDGLELDHLCNNRRCVDVDHLEPVTHQENIRRATARRRRTAYAS